MTSARETIHLTNLSGLDVYEWCKKNEPLRSIQQQYGVRIPEPCYYYPFQTTEMDRTVRTRPRTTVQLLREQVKEFEHTRNQSAPSRRQCTTAPVMRKTSRAHACSPFGLSRVSQRSSPIRGYQQRPFTAPVGLDQSRSDQLAREQALDNAKSISYLINKNWDEYKRASVPDRNYTKILQSSSRSSDWYSFQGGSKNTGLVHAFGSGSSSSSANNFVIDAMNSLSISGKLAKNQRVMIGINGQEAPSQKPPNIVIQGDSSDSDDDYQQSVLQPGSWNELLKTPGVKVLIPNPPVEDHHQPANDSQPLTFRKPQVDLDEMKKKARAKSSSSVRVHSKPKVNLDGSISHHNSIKSVKFLGPNSSST